MRFLLATLVMASCIRAQTPQTFEIRGTITEPGLGGIAGVPVYVQLFNPNVRLGSIPATYTDGRGQFVFRTERAGTYLVIPQIEGYSRDSAQTKVDENHPRADVSISLVRLAQITGRVVDPETRQPVPEVVVAAMQRVAQGGGIVWTAPRGGQALVMAQPDPVQMVAAARRYGGLTGKDGIFTIAGLMPGDYAVSILQAGSGTGPGFSTEFSPDDLEATDQSAVSLFWPGGVRKQDASAFPLASGGLFNVGDISLNKMTQYRALIASSQGACPEGESVRLTLFRVGSADSRSQTVPCGKDVLLRGLEPGSHVLYGVSDWQGERDNVEAAFWGTASFEVMDKNTKAVLSLERGIILDGQLVAAVGVDSIPPQLGLAMRPTEIAAGASPPVEQFIEWGENGRFHMAVYPGPQALQQFPGRDNFYVAQIRYNGSPLSSFTIPVKPGASVQRLELVIDNRKGNLIINVPDEANPVVVLLRTTDGSIVHVPRINGVFHVANLIVGDYLAMAERSVDPVAELMIGDDLRSNPGAGTKVTIRGGATETIDLKVNPVPRR